MNNSLIIIIPGTPIAKMRSRKGMYGNWYNPQSDIMGRIQRIIKDQLPESFMMIPKGTPVIINTTWFFLPAKNQQTKKFLKQIQNEDYPYLLKKDRDNLDKFVLDSMNKIVFYDDCQVYGGSIYKYYTHDNPRTEVEILW